MSEHEHIQNHGEEHEEGGIPWMLIICGILFAVSFLLPASWRLLWLAATVLWPLWPVLCEAREELADRRMGENTLLVIATVAAFCIGEGSEGALVVLLFSLGEWLEDRAMDHSRETISALAAVAPDTALALSADGTVREISASAVAVGDTLRIPPHGRVPVDCRVAAGASVVDTSALTGESAPRAVAAGSDLLSGTVNGDGMLTVVATRRCEESAAARILSLVEESADRKGQAEKFITRFARIYTPAVTVAAVLVATVPPLIAGGNWLDWLYRALAFLVASCPCALVISIPLGFYAGIASAAHMGVLIKGGCYVESIAKANAAAFDKTGTLTTGALTLTDVVLTADIDREEALRLAAAVERNSTHPIARALCAAAADLPPVEELRELPGIGVTGLVDGSTVSCGGARLLERDGIAVPDDGGSAYLVRDGVLLATFVLSAALQEGAAQTVADLRQAGLYTVMLTGDRASAACPVAADVGVEETYADLLPEDKLTQVRRLQADGRCVLFVGDGVNDAPVLAAADVGIAMGWGSPAAIETADAVLMTEGLRRLPDAVRLCRRAVRIVRGNIIFALSVKAAVLILAVVGIAPMWLAVFADMGVTLISVANALRLLKYR